MPAYFTHPKNSIFSIATRHPAVLLLHGANDFWGKNEDWSLEWMDILAREGWCVLVADFYGFGERKKAGQKPQWWGSGSYTMQSVTDQRRGIDFLFSRPEVDTTKVALMGGSMGGYYGTLVAGLESRLTTVVLTVPGFAAGRAPDDALARFSHILNFAPRVSAWPCIWRRAL
ncbi:MAG: alpha/beta fold hydrolase [Candidatus Latescibacteria bacterium]|nr:alpha/beta fold hydrolase [Candidatus Latescibacterota bacterium]